VGLGQWVGNRVDAIGDAASQVREAVVDKVDDVKQAVKGAEPAVVPTPAGANQAGRPNESQASHVSAASTRTPTAPTVPTRRPDAPEVPVVDPQAAKPRTGAEPVYRGEIKVPPGGVWGWVNDRVDPLRQAAAERWHAITNTQPILVEHASFVLRGESIARGNADASYNRYLGDAVRDQIRPAIEPYLAGNGEPKAFSARALTELVGAALHEAPSEAAAADGQLRYEGAARARIDRVAQALMRAGGTHAPKLSVVPVFVRNDRFEPFAPTVHPQFSAVPLFRVVAADGTDRFVDAQGSTYRDLEHWKQTNALPPTDVIVPKQARLGGGRGGQVELESFSNQRWDNLAWAAAKTTVYGAAGVAGAVALASGGAVVAGPVFVAGSVVGAIDGVDQIKTLVEHKRPPSFSDPEWRGALLTTAASSLSLGNGVLQSQQGLTAQLLTGAESATGLLETTEAGRQFVQQYGQMTPAERLQAAAQISFFGALAAGSTVKSVNDLRGGTAKADGVSTAGTDVDQPAQPAATGQRPQGAAHAVGAAPNGFLDAPQPPAEKSIIELPQPPQTEPSSTVDPLVSNALATTPENRKLIEALIVPRTEHTGAPSTASVDRWVRDSTKGIESDAQAQQVAYRETAAYYRSGTNPAYANRNAFIEDPLGQARSPEADKPALIAPELPAVLKPINDKVGHVAADKLMRSVLDVGSDVVAQPQYSGVTLYHLGAMRFAIEGPPAQVQGFADEWSARLDQMAWGYTAGGTSYETTGFPVVTTEPTAPAGASRKDLLFAAIDQLDAEAAKLKGTVLPQERGAPLLTMRSSAAPEGEGNGLWIADRRSGAPATAQPDNEPAPSRRAAERMSQPLREAIGELTKGIRNNEQGRAYIQQTVHKSFTTDESMGGHVGNQLAFDRVEKERVADQQIALARGREATPLWHGFVDVGAVGSTNQQISRFAGDVVLSAVHKVAAEVASEINLEKGLTGAHAVEVFAVGGDEIRFIASSQDNVELFADRFAAAMQKTEIEGQSVGDVSAADPAADPELRNARLRDIPVYIGVGQTKEVAEARSNDSKANDPQRVPGQLPPGYRVRPAANPSRPAEQALGQATTAAEFKAAVDELAEVAPGRLLSLLADSHARLLIERKLDNMPPPQRAAAAQALRDAVSAAQTRLRGGTAPADSDTPANTATEAEAARPGRQVRQPVESVDAAVKAVRDGVLAGKPVVVEGEISFVGRGMRDVIIYADEHGDVRVGVMHYTQTEQGRLEHIHPLPVRDGEVMFPDLGKDAQPLSQLEVFRGHLELRPLEQPSQARHVDSFADVRRDIGSGTSNAHVDARDALGRPVSFTLQWRNGELVTDPPLSPQQRDGLRDLRYTPFASQTTVEKTAAMPTLALATPLPKYTDDVSLGVTYRLPDSVRTLGDIETNAQALYRQLSSAGRPLRFNVFGEPQRGLLRGRDGSGDHFQLELKRQSDDSVTVRYLAADGTVLPRDAKDRPLLTTPKHPQGTPLDQRRYAAVALDMHEVTDGAPAATLYQDSRIDVEAQTENTSVEPYGNLGDEAAGDVDRVFDSFYEVPRHVMLDATLTQGHNALAANQPFPWKLGTDGSPLTLLTKLQEQPYWFASGEPGNASDTLLATVSVRNWQTGERADFMMRIPPKVQPRFGRARQEIEYFDLAGNRLPTDASGRLFVWSDQRNGQVSLDSIGAEQAAVSLRRQRSDERIGDGSPPPRVSGALNREPALDIDRAQRVTIPFVAADPIDQLAHPIHHIRYKEKDLLVEPPPGTSNQQRVRDMLDNFTRGFRQPAIANVAARDASGTVQNFLIRATPEASNATSAAKFEYLDMTYQPLSEEAIARLDAASFNRVVARFSPIDPNSGVR
jgi:hypothetical protein